MPTTDNETLADHEFLTALADNVETLIDRCNSIDQQLAHIDVQVHEVLQFIEEHRPALARAMSFMNGGLLGGWRKGKTDG